MLRLDNVIQDNPVSNKIFILFGRCLECTLCFSRAFGGSNWIVVLDLEKRIYLKRGALFI